MNNTQMNMIFMNSALKNVNFASIQLHLTKHVSVSFKPVLNLMQFGAKTPRG